MNRKFRSAATAVVLLGAALAAVPPTAEAATSVTYDPVQIWGPRAGARTPPSGAPDHNVLQLKSVSLSMAAGQTAYVVSVMIANGATETSLFDNEVRCSLPDGTSKNMVIGENVYKSGSGHPDWEQRALTTRFLVQAPTAGTVTCTGYARVASQSLLDTTVQLASGSLAFADSSVDNDIAGKPIQASVPNGLVKVDATTPTARVPAIDLFEVAPGFDGLSVFGDTEFMVCHSKTCGQTQTTATFRLYVNQWKEDGVTPCRPTVASEPLTKTMSYWVHHHYIPLHLPNVTVETANGCAPKFNAYVKVDWVSGETGAVQGVATPLEDSRGSTTTHSSDMSHAYVVPYHL
ncbi:hypothetical protein FB561_3527 [Kribbella amoyensis]|uniref:DUF11 domain-containing protein n=1 Tax=Kribbella amoyensis TaxID=996641 RepID=A0A561BU63_9ACTN|nr:hypothetical protein [Kribbella amoyensis]TWD82397.1 hypothetical protein FB561_3527 [Kribbella amoyensis]